jgi:sigma-54-interacting transcriptional regulator
MSFVGVRTCGRPLRRLPRADCAALILKTWGALTEAQQEELSQWLDSGPRVTVVSVSSSSLFSQVENGTFSERLYYRLNTILEDEDTAFGTASWLVKNISR